MQKYKGAVFFDFDGTLVDEKERLYVPTEETQRSLEQLKKNGYMVGLATGRALCYVPENGIEFDCYVTSNGACASVDGVYIADDRMSQEELRRLISYFDENDFGYITENDRECFYSRRNQDAFIRMMENFNISTDCFHLFPEDISRVSANKMMFTYEGDDEFLRLDARFGDEFNITRHRSNPSGDLVKKKINKAFGIRAVIEAYGLELANTYAFGDGENDYEMLAAVGHGIVMGRHADKLRSVGDYITDTVIGEGVTKGLAHFDLI